MNVHVHVQLTSLFEQEYKKMKFIITNTSATPAYLHTTFTLTNIIIILDLYTVTQIGGIITHCRSLMQ
jgi:hypothetical protein